MPYYHVGNPPLNFVDPTGLSLAKPYANLPKLTPATPKVNLAGGLSSYSTPKAIDNYFFDQGLKNLANPLAAPNVSFTAPTQQQIFNAQFNPHGGVVSVKQIGSGPVGDVYRGIGPSVGKFVQTTNSPIAAGVAQFFKPVLGLAGNIAGGLVDAVLPPSDPDVVVRYADGTRRVTPGTPSTGALANQALLLAPPVLSGTSRPAGQLVFNSGQNSSTLNSSRPIHGNSLDYVGDTHVYRIKGPDGSTYKIGESMQGTRVRDGASIRAEAQARQLTRETGDVYKSEIRTTFPGKASARDYETRVIDRFRRMFGDDTLPGNRTNR
jgi:hypothetical protein